MTLRGRKWFGGRTAACLKQPILQTNSKRGSNRGLNPNLSPDSFWLKKHILQPETNCGLKAHPDTKFESRLKKLILQPGSHRASTSDQMRIPDHDV